jgi:3-isopropylmalate/(R)-2-methylmalate dehydratase large subunit
VKVIEIDASKIRPMVALPGDPGNGLYIDELGSHDPHRRRLCRLVHGRQEGGHGHVRRRAAGRPRRRPARAPDVKLFIQCGSQEVRQYCDERGYLKLFEEMGAEFIEPGCGACIAAGPGTSKTKDEVTISSQNRNFPGRSGPGQLYLASPYTVAASAVAGYITEWRPGVAIAQLEAGVSERDDRTSRR